MCGFPCRIDADIRPQIKQRIILFYHSALDFEYTVMDNYTCKETDNRWVRDGKFIKGDRLFQPICYR